MSRQIPPAATKASTVNDEMLSELSDLERADLLKCLLELTAPEFTLSQHLLTEMVSPLWRMALITPPISPPISPQIEATQRN
jgi:hypothetical protein